MASKAAATTFETNSTTPALVGDPSLIANNAVMNILPSTEGDGLSITALKKLTGANDALGIVNSLQAKLDLGAFNPETIKDNISKFGSNITKGLTDGLENLAGDMLTNALKSTGWIDDNVAKMAFGEDGKLSISEAKAMYKGLKMVVDDVETFIDNADFKSVAGISNIINDIVGETELAKVLNIETELSVLKFVNDLSTVWGVPNALDKLMGTLPDDESKKVFVTESLPATITSGNLSTLNTAVNTLGAVTVTALYPKIVPTVLSNYSYDKGNHYPTGGQLNTLVESLQNIDPDWAYTYRNGRRIFNLEPFMKCSRSALDLLLMSEEFKHPALIAKTNKFVERTVNEYIKMYYINNL